MSDTPLVHKGVSIHVLCDVDKEAVAALFDKFEAFLDMTPDGSHVTPEDFAELHELLTGCITVRCDDVPLH